LAISPVSSNPNSYQTNQTDDGWQQFSQLVQSVNAGDLSAAQQAYTDFSQSGAAKVAAANPDSPLAKALSEIGQSLQSGDVSGAQQALSSLRPHRHGGHHHGGAKTETSAPAADSAQGAPASAPNAPGATVNLTV
jgi:hypothetical protein